MLNHITLMGRLTRDPELRRTQQGTAVISFALACERDYAPQGQERQTDFINVVAWRNTAEFIAQYFAKGRMMIVSGRLQTRSYTDSDGNKRTATEILAESVYFGDSKREDAAANERTEPSDAPYTAPVTPSGYVDYDPDDYGDLPF